MTAAATPGQREFDRDALDPDHHDLPPSTGPGAAAGEVLHASLRGAIAAAAMTGMREFTVNVGLVEKPPPRAVVDKKGGILRLIPRKRQRAVVELLHWGYGAQGGAMFGLLPDRVRRRPWSGPVYGLALWLGFELVLGPLLGLKRSDQPRPVERLALAADHALYGFVLSEMRPRPQE